MPSAGGDDDEGSCGRGVGDGLAGRRSGACGERAVRRLLALPSLPAPADALKGTRDTCFKAADLVKDNPATTKSNEHDAAVSACNAANPSPPANPSLPASVSMDLGKIAK